MNCPKCGKAVAAGAAFCDGCGTPTDQSAQPPPATPPQPTGSGGKWVLIGGVALLLVVMLAVAGFFGGRWWRNRNQPSPEPLTQVQPSDQPAVEPISPPPSDSSGPTHAGPGDGSEDQEPEYEEPVERDSSGDLEWTQEEEDEVCAIAMAYFTLWAEGDLDGVRKICGDGLNDSIQPEEVGDGYDLHYVEVTDFKMLQDGCWQVRVTEALGDYEGKMDVGSFVVRVSRYADDVLRIHTAWAKHWINGQPTGEENEYYAALMAAHLFFKAWSEGDPYTIVEQMTDELAEQSDAADFEEGYTQEGLEVKNAEQASETRWDFTLRETFRTLDDDETLLEATYAVSVVSPDTEYGWRVASWEKVD